MDDPKKSVPLHRERLNLPDNEAQRVLKERKRKQLVEDMRICFTTPSGRRVLRYLMNICGYKKSKVGGNPGIGMDVHAGLLYNCARENVCLEFIEFIPEPVLKEVEFGNFEDLLE